MKEKRKNVEDMILGQTRENNIFGLFGAVLLKV